MSDIPKVKAELDDELDRLAAFVQKAYKSKIRWLRTGEPLKTIQAEVGTAIAMGRMDLVSNLLDRQRRIEYLMNILQSAEYQQRFIEAAPLPDELGEKDSTLFLDEPK
jgi:predicted ATPase